MFNAKSGGSGLPEKLGEKQYRQRSKSVRKCPTTKFPQSNGTQRTALWPYHAGCAHYYRPGVSLYHGFVQYWPGRWLVYCDNSFPIVNVPLGSAFFLQPNYGLLKCEFALLFYFYHFSYTGWIVSTRKTLITDCGKALRLFCLFQIFVRAKFCPEYCQKSALRNSSKWQPIARLSINMADLDRSSS